MKKNFVKLVMAMVLALGFAGQAQAQSVVDWCKNLGNDIELCRKAVVYLPDSCNPVPSDPIAKGTCEGKLTTALRKARRAARRSRNRRSRRTSRRRGRRFSTRNMPKNFQPQTLREITPYLGHNPQTKRCKQGKCFRLIDKSNEQKCIIGSYALRVSTTFRRLRNKEDHGRCLDESYHNAQDLCQRMLDDRLNDPLAKQYMQNEPEYENLRFQIVGKEIGRADKNPYELNMRLSSDRVSDSRPYNRRRLRGKSIVWLTPGHVQGRDILRRDVTVQIGCRIIGLAAFNNKFITKVAADVNNLPKGRRQAARRALEKLKKRVRKLERDPKNFITKNEFNTFVKKHDADIAGLKAMIKAIKRQVTVCFSAGYSGWYAFNYNVASAYKVYYPANVDFLFELWFRPTKETNWHITTHFAFQPNPHELKGFTGFGWYAGGGALYEFTGDTTNNFIGPELSWVEPAFNFAPLFKQLTYHGLRLEFRWRIQFAKAMFFQMNAGVQVMFEGLAVQTSFTWSAKLGVMSF